MTPLVAALLLTGSAFAASLEYAATDAYVDVSEGGVPVLRYNHRSTAVPEGIGPELARGDYVSALYGLDGELLTDDYPKDHPHHRAVNWSWATIRWNGEDRDLFAVRGILARPVGKPRVTSTDGSLVITAESQWKWDDETPVVAEAVTIRIFPQEESGRAVDFDITLNALVDGLEFCGRLEAGYSGFNIRMAPAPGQEIVFHSDAADMQPRRAWADYSSAFSGSTGRSGLAILQHAANPGYPQEWRQYPELNFFQPIYPGGTPIPLSKSEPVRLRYRLWIHRGGAHKTKMDEQWDAYNNTSSR